MTADDARTRVIVADDHPIWISGLRADLGELFDVVGEAGEATEAIALIDQLSPDVALVDLNMPKGRRHGCRPAAWRSDQRGDSDGVGGRA